MGFAGRHILYHYQYPLEENALASLEDWHFGLLLSFWLMD